MSKSANLKLLVLLAMGLVLPLAAQAASSATNTVLEKDTRPTIKDIQSLLRKVKPRLGSDFDDQQLEEIEERMPFLIAILEKAYPGATFAVLGRDSALFGDILDGFYRSIGQTGRVVRINASGDAINAASDEDLVRMLKDAGMKIQGAKYPFIMLDATRYNQQSQSVQLLAVAYNAMGDTGMSDRKILNLVNFVNLKPGMYNKNIADRDFDFKDFRRRVEKKSKGDVPSEILSIEAANLTYSPEWHGTFSTLEKQRNGKFEGTPGAVSAPHIRKLILAQQIEIYKIVTDRDFLANVKKEAKKLGYEFSMTRTDKIKLPPPMSRLDFLKSVEESFDEKVEDMLEAADLHGQYISHNAESLWDWLEDELTRLEVERRRNPALAPVRNEIILYYISRLSYLFKDNVILYKDYRRLLAPALSTAKIDNDFIKKFGALYDEDIMLKKTILKHSEYFLTTYKNKKRQGTEKTAQAFRAIVSKLDCPYLLTDEYRNIEADDEPETE